jgi:hypothetical protein
MGPALVVPFVRVKNKAHSFALTSVCFALSDISLGAPFRLSVAIVSHYMYVNITTFTSQSNDRTAVIRCPRQVK